MNRILGLCTLLLATGYLIATARLPTVLLGDRLGPKMFPYLIGGMMLVTGAILAISPGRPAPDLSTAETAPAASATSEALGIIGVLVWTALYFFLFEAAGYLLATLAYLFMLLFFMHRGRYTMNVAVTIAYTFGSYWMFSALGVDLPASF